MELEEAIKILKEDLESTKKANECGLSNNDFKKEIEATETVLTHLTKQEKMIELMASYIMCKVPFTKETRCLELKEDARTKNSVKQYFEKKAEES